MPNLSQADDSIAQGEKYLKTSFFKWKPDYDSAAPCFSKAAVAYKNAKKYEKARDLYLKAATCYFKNSSRFHAGKAYEEAGLVSKELKEFDKLMAHFDHASDLYLEEGTPDTAALCLIRAGKLVESVEPSWALKVFQKAVDIYESEEDGRLRSAVEVQASISRLLVKTEKFEEAIESIDKEINLWNKVDGSDNGASARLVCCQVLLYLQLGDEVQANQSLSKATENVTGFDETEQYYTLCDLLKAFSERNYDKGVSLLNQPLFKYMDVVYARLTKTIHVPGHSNTDSKQISQSKNLNLSNDDDDDDLC